MTNDASAQQVRGLDMQTLERLVELSAEPPSRRIDHALEIAREFVGMDFGYLTEFVGDEQLLRRVSGDSDSFDMTSGDGYPLDGTYCQRMIVGTIPNAVANTAESDELRDLALTKLSAIGAYVGVPIVLSSGKLYGSLCTINHEAKSELGAPQVRLMELLSKIVAAGIEQQRVEKENQRLRARIAGMTDELDAAEEDRRMSRILLSGEFKTIPRGTPPPE